MPMGYNITDRWMRNAGTQSHRHASRVRQRQIPFNFAVRTRVADGRSRVRRATGIHGTLENPWWDYEA